MDYPGIVNIIDYIRDVREERVEEGLVDDNEDYRQGSKNKSKTMLNNKARKHKIPRTKDTGILVNKCSSEVKIVIKNKNHVTISIEVSPSDTQSKNEESRNFCDNITIDPNFPPFGNERGDPMQENPCEVETSGVECEKFNVKDESKRQS